MSIERIRPGILAATSFEARSLCAATGGARARPLVRVCGVGAAHAARAAEDLIRAGATGLAVWGLASALEPDLRVGGVLLPSRVGCGDDAAYEVDAAWRGAVRARLARALPCATGLLVQVDDVLASAAAKRRTRNARAAFAADMESGAVAAAAYEARLPCLVIKAVCDRAADALPTGTTDVLRSQRTPDPLRLLRALLRRPRDLPRWARLSMQGVVAYRRLQQVARLLGPDLAFDARATGRAVH